jgi:DNA (cytosine-5)-methyltransferase 1
MIFCMKYLSTFSGIGGFELGIQQAYANKTLEKTPEQTRNTLSSRKLLDIRHRLGGEEATCIGYSEIDKYATSIYQKHFPNHKNYGDITTINAGALPDFEMLVGGFPCQSFSIAGKRHGFNDTRGTMFFEIARIVREKQPRLLLLENVKGLLSHDQGRTFTTIIATLDELGYDCQWQVLNSKNHGVPQNRERVFIIGHLRGTPRPEVFPFGDDSKATPVVSGQCSNTLTTRYYGGQANGTYVTEGEQYAQEIVQLNQPTHSNDRVYGTDGVSPTLNTMQGGNRQPFIPEDSRIRRLTPTECERLQGFPDGWTEGVSDTQRYKTLGNAVTVNVIKDVFSRIMV